jgi:protein gp37
MKQAHRFGGKGGAYEWLTQMTRGGPVWTGVVRIAPWEIVTAPLRWRPPRRVFVDSMSDLFHENVSDGDISRVFAVMALARHHTFQILTKRAERMWNYMESPARLHMVRISAYQLLGGHKEFERFGDAGLDTWPPPNVWLGVSVEDQARADERIGLLVRTAAAVRFLSIEPILGPVDLATWLPVDTIGGVEMERWPDWVIVGGESGPGARPTDIGHILSIVQQCKAAGVPVFVKQLGARPEWNDPEPDFSEPPHWMPIKLRDKKGGNMEEWSADLRVREFPCGI